MEERGIRKNHTAKAIQRLKAGAKPYEISDTTLRGFLARVQASGAILYYAVAQKYGKRATLSRLERHAKWGRAAGGALAKLGDTTHIFSGYGRPACSSSIGLDFS